MNSIEPTSLVARAYASINCARMRVVLVCMAILFALSIILTITLGLAHWRASVSLKADYDSVVTQNQRPLAHTRGLVDSMIDARETFTPAFIPQHLSDQAMCDGAIVGATNFLLGFPKLTESAAWQFGQANSSQLELLYDRSDDFTFVEDPLDETSHELIEKRNSPFKLSALLRPRMQGGTTDRLIVIGYHYQFTLVDNKIYADGAGLNSHLMLLLGRADGSWWGYHMYHKHGETDAPFHIDSLADDMPDEFDLVYIWEVRGTKMPRDGAPLQFIQQQSPYESTKKLVGWRFLDQALVELFSGDDQFPHVGLRNDATTIGGISDLLYNTSADPDARAAKHHENVVGSVTVTGYGPAHTVSAAVSATPGADLATTFACNGWDIREQAHHKVYLHQVFKLCGK